MTNVAFRLGKVHALGDVVVLDVNTYNVLLGLPAFVALRGNLDFECRSVILRNTRGKPYVIPMRLTLRTSVKVVPRISPETMGALRMVSWNAPVDGGQSSNDAGSDDDDDPVVTRLVRQRIHYPPPRTIARTMHLTTQNAHMMIMGEPLVQISRLVDSLEPPRTLYEGVSPLLLRYSDKRSFCDLTGLPRSLLQPAKEVQLLRLGAEAGSLEPPQRIEARSDELGIKISPKSVHWRGVCDGITPEGHTTIREEEAQMVATVFSWRSDHSFISASPDTTRRIHTKQVNVQILDQMYELHVPQYVPDEIHRLIADILIEYRGAISVSDADIGLSVVVQHEIQTGNHSPIHYKPYRYSLTERKTALQRIKEFEANGWIEPATGPWSFPVVLVPKKNGSVRICIDYRKLNDITIKDVYPLPRIDDLLDAIGCANYFSKFDIRHGFHHILVKEEDRPKTAFVLFEGTWQWVRCPMGICNAPATFQQAMNVTFHNFVNKTRLTQGIINFCVIVYMDDILVYSDTFHGHAQHIEWTLGALRDARFKIALEKSEFCLLKISFLEYVVTREGLRPDSRKVAAVKEAPVPTSLTQVRAFLGLASYYRRFIKGFAAIARPLTNLLRKEQPLHWDDECDQAFGALKDALVTAPILIRPDPSRQFILITDWQPEAISAILVQKGNDGKEHVVEYASRTVPDEQRNDSAPQGECYAVVWGIQHFHPYLYCNGSEAEVRPGCRRLLTQELTVPIAQLADDLDVNIVSQVDPRLVPHVTSRTLSPYLQWSACVEGFPSKIPPSRLDYLDPRDIVDPSFYRLPYEDELEEIVREELAEESSEEEEENLNEDEGETAQQREGDEDELLQTESEEETEEGDSEQGSGDDNDE
ncbi:hypothetical protein CBR_g30050 [Chara braunii]|uniref:Reverse transcriptase domain-containing protein n=1 Tax=Chara braunii TaxID=69332 RepID=A0A388LBV7_CHABU|nr:hypothetical protein CBR_g30050 [Chara braunii]|eukprot:GBG79788.1 hypothetical protein CBR_g30050 [Chara braunii]